MPQNNYKTFRPKSGFSLIELLATISVVAILATILYAVVNRAMATAATTKSVSNIRQVGMAMLTYASDNDNTLPNKMQPGKPSVVSFQLFDPYLHHDDPAWICPIIADLNQGGVSQSDQGRYTYFWRLTNSNDGWRDGLSAISIYNVVNPSEAMVCANLTTGSRGGYWDGYANVAFVDGSVRRVPDGTYNGGNVYSIDGVTKNYILLQGGKLRGYDF